MLIPMPSGMTDGIKRVLLFLLIGLAAFLLLCLFINCFFTAPEGDVFYYAAISNRLGIGAAQEQWYMHWSGRIIPTFILSLSDSFIRHNWIYQLFSTCIILGFYLTVFAFLNRCFVFRHKASLYVCTAIFILGLTQLFASIPAMYYWLPGSLTYTCPLLLGFWGLHLLFQEKTRSRVFGLALLLLFSTMNEIISLQAAGLFLFLLLSREYRDKHRLLLTGFIAVLAGGLILYTAPGNFERESIHHGALSLPGIFLYSNKALGLDLMNWLGSSPILLLGLLALMLRILPLGVKEKISRVYKNKYLFYGFVYTALLLPYLFFYKLGGSYPPERVINLVGCEFMVFAFFVLVEWSVKLRVRANSTLVFGRFATIVLTLLILYNLNAHDKNVSAIVTDSVGGRGADYAKEYKAQVAAMSVSRKDTVEIPRVHILAPSLSFTVLDDDTNRFQYHQCCFYFKKKRIIVKKTD